MTPTASMSAAPSPTLVVLNGGIRRIDLSWDAGRPGRRLRGVTEPVIPNRCLSVSRCVCPRSRSSWRERDLPPPGAQGMCGRHPATATAVMGRLDRRRRRRECSEDPSPQTLNVPLDSQRFIDALRSLAECGSGGNHRGIEGFGRRVARAGRIPVGEDSRRGGCEGGFSHQPILWCGALVSVVSRW